MRAAITRSAFVLLVAGGVLFLGGRAAITIRDADISDFRCFYEAGRLVRLGLDPYDVSTWTSATKSDPSRLPPCPDTFAYPLWTGMFLVPFSIASVQVAVIAYEFVLLAAVVAGVACVARTWSMVGGASLLLVLVLWSAPMYSAIANAQPGPLLLLGLAAAALALERAREPLAAAAWCLLLIKPNVVALAILGMPVLGTRRFARYALGMALAISVLSLALVPTWPIDVLRAIFGQRLLVDPDLSTLSSVALALGLPAALGMAAAVFAVAVFLLALPRRRPRPRVLVAILALTSFVLTPYARPQDFVALAVCWAAPLALAKTADPRRRSLLVGTTMAVVLVLPWVIVELMRMGLPPSLYVVVSLATAGLTAYALRSQPLGEMSG